MIRTENSAEKVSDISIVWAELTELASLNLLKLTVKKSYQIKIFIYCY